MKDIICLLISRLFESAAARTGFCAPATAVFCCATSTVTARHGDAVKPRNKQHLLPRY